MEKNLHQELEELSPFLLQMRENSEGRSVPEGYFEQMQQSVLQQVKPVILATKSSGVEISAAKNDWLQDWVNIFTIWIQPRYALGFASIVGLVFGVWFWQKNLQHSDECTTINCVPDEEVEQYIQEYISDFDSEQLWAWSESEIIDNNNNIEHINDEQQPNDPEKKHLIQEATDNEIDDLLDEMINNGEVDTEDLNNIL